VRREAGFSLVEAMVAAVVLAVGVLGVAGSGTAARRLADHAHHTGQAVHAAAGQLVALARDPCGAGADSASVGGVRLAWSLSGGPAVRPVRITVTVPGVPSDRQVVVDGALLCADSLP